MTPIPLNLLLGLILFASVGALAAAVASAVRAHLEITPHLPPQFRTAQYMLPHLWVFAPWVPREAQLRYQRRLVFQTIMGSLMGFGFAIVCGGSGQRGGGIAFALMGIGGLLVAWREQRKRKRLEAGEPSEV